MIIPEPEQWRLFSGEQQNFQNIFIHRKDVYGKQSFSVENRYIYGRWPVVTVCESTQPTIMGHVTLSLIDNTPTRI